jgi:hypothetical protein
MRRVFGIAYFCVAGCVGLLSGMLVVGSVREYGAGVLDVPTVLILIVLPAIVAAGSIWSGWSLLRPARTSKPTRRRADVRR